MKSPAKYRTQGGGIVVWTFTHFEHGNCEVGSLSCSGCGLTAAGKPSHHGNRHAQLCHAIP